MPPCASTQCTSTLPSASEVAEEADPAIKPEVVATICFGLIMFLLAVLTLWQGRKQLRRPATQGIPTCCWPRPLNTTVLVAVDKLPHHRSGLSGNNCLEGTKSSPTALNDC
ncbi:MAG: hypothetical protein L6R36_009113 [Xanthoria steineri]|nr:MAG: hypothetical protein L6R36_009113 [Xanthoria steineri]